MQQDKKIITSNYICYARTAGVSQFYQMNDVIVSWLELQKFRGKHCTVIEDRSYTRDVIKRLVNFASSEFASSDEHKSLGIYEL